MNSSLSDLASMRKSCTVSLCRINSCPATNCRYLWDIAHMTNNLLNMNKKEKRTSQKQAHDSKYSVDGKDNFATRNDEPVLNGPDACDDGLLFDEPFTILEEEDELDYEVKPDNSRQGEKNVAYHEKTEIQQCRDKKLINSDIPPEPESSNRQAEESDEDASVTGEFSSESDSEDADTSSNADSCDNESDQSEDNTSRAPLYSDSDKEEFDKSLDHTPRAPSDSETEELISTSDGEKDEQPGVEGKKEEEKTQRGLSSQVAISLECSQDVEAADEVMQGENFLKQNDDAVPREGDDDGSKLAPKKTVSSDTYRAGEEDENHDVYTSPEMHGTALLNIHKEFTSSNTRDVINLSPEDIETVLQQQEDEEVGLEKDVLCGILDECVGLGGVVHIEDQSQPGSLEECDLDRDLLGCSDQDDFQEQEEDSFSPKSLRLDDVLSILEADDGLDATLDSQGPRQSSLTENRKRHVPTSPESSPPLKISSSGYTVKTREHKGQELPPFKLPNQTHTFQSPKTCVFPQMEPLRHPPPSLLDIQVPTPERYARQRKQVDGECPVPLFPFPVEKGDRLQDMYSNNNVVTGRCAGKSLPETLKNKRDIIQSDAATSGINGIRSLPNNQRTSAESDSSVLFPHTEVNSSPPQEHSAGYYPEVAAGIHVSIAGASQIMPFSNTNVSASSDIGDQPRYHSRGPSTPPDLPGVYFPEEHAESDVENAEAGPSVSFYNNISPPSLTAGTSQCHSVSDISTSFSKVQTTPMYSTAGFHAEPLAMSSSDPQSEAHHSVICNNVLQLNDCRTRAQPHETPGRFVNMRNKWKKSPFCRKDSDHPSPKMTTNTSPDKPGPLFQQTEKIRRYCKMGQLSRALQLFNQVKLQEGLTSLDKELVQELMNWCIIEEQEDQAMLLMDDLHKLCKLNKHKNSMTNLSASFDEEEGSQHGDEDSKQVVRSEDHPGTPEQGEELNFPDETNLVLTVPADILHEMRNRGFQEDWEGLACMYSAVSYHSKHRLSTDCLHLMATCFLEQPNLTNIHKGFSCFLSSVKENAHCPLTFELAYHYNLGATGIRILLACKERGLWYTGYQLLFLLHQQGVQYAKAAHVWNISMTQASLLAAEICLVVGQTEGALQVFEGCDWALNVNQTDSTAVAELRLHLIGQLLLLVLDGMSSEKNEENKTCLMRNASKAMVAVLKTRQEDMDNLENYKSIVDVHSLFNKAIIAAIKCKDVESITKLCKYQGKDPHMVRLNGRVLRGLILFFCGQGFEDSSCSDQHFTQAGKLMEQGRGSGIYPVQLLNFQTLLGREIIIWSCLSREEIFITVYNFLKKLYQHLAQIEAFGLMVQRKWGVYLSIRQKNLIENFSEEINTVPAASERAHHVLNHVFRPPLRVEQDSVVDMLVLDEDCVKTHLYLMEERGQVEPPVIVVKSFYGNSIT